MQLQAPLFGSSPQKRSSGPAVKTNPQLCMCAIYNDFKDEASGLRPHRNTGAMTSVIVASILIRTWIEGPAVSLNGSPTVSPVIAAL